MKRKGLYLLVALALGAFGAAHAQDATDSSTPANGYDGRWYIAPTIGGYYNDSDRNTNSRQLYYGIGFGRFVNSFISLDVFADRTKRELDTPAGGYGVHNGGSWASTSVGVAGRFYANGWGGWRPYLLGGVMGSYHRDPMDDGWAPAAELGVGVAKSVSARTDLRIEGGYRYDWDSDSISSRKGFGDWFLGLSIATRLGPNPEAAPPPPPVAPPPPPAPDCSKEFRNGVNLCDNKCPNLPEGTIVGPDGCPQKVVIDLRGVNFKFDFPKKGQVKASEIARALAEPTADSLAILDQAVDTLKRYPQVHVTVAGYTDSVGTPKYNQALSERRAQIVYDYLTSHGIDASRLDGPIGHGENDPVASNKTADGRARNRRTELQVQQ